MSNDLQGTAHLFSANAPFLEALFEDYLEDPASVPETWRKQFDEMTGRPATAEIAPSSPPISSPTAPDPRPAVDADEDIGEWVPSEDAQVVSAVSGRPAIPAQKQSGVRQLILAYRMHGHMTADLDPIHLRERSPIKALTLEEHHLSEADLDLVFDTGNMWGPQEATLREILDVLKATYTGHIGVEYIHINDLEQRNWIRERLERTRSSARLPPEAKLELLRRISAAEGMERFLHTRYSGQKRFSLEGGENLITMLDALIERCGAKGVKELALGMAHRGRLNVLINVLGKQPKDLFMQFENRFEAARGSGDVKYHEGYSSNMMTAGGPVHLAMAFNPSHLEIIGPVVEGSVRSRQDRRKDFARDQVIPILIHGDAAIAGQGVVYETFSLAQTRGFTTGGTIHIVVNNQIGFTLSNPLDTRSTLYCTDIAKVVQSPIFHVNADDPEAVTYVALLAAEYRLQFHKDVMIDLVSYRRHGHNEADEPSATQPMMYQKIRSHPSVREVYANRLIAEGVIDKEGADQMVAEYRTKLESGQCVAPKFDPQFNYPYIADWSEYLNRTWDTPADTRLRPDVLKFLGERITHVPDDFELHPRVRKVMDDRRKMVAGALPMDWGCAETLAYASVLNDGYPVRLTGQDSGRGTFFHRHAVLHNQRNGESLIPLRNIRDGQPWMTVVDSILSEEAVLGFEYGYSTTDPDTLVVWEAQFGDFVNGAQVVIDQFLSSSEQKWRRLCGLVMMLPHGWEGQGPEHSSARLERFMQLCAEDNIQVCVPSTPAQMFHVLRREMVRPYRKPLVILSPKSTLRRKISFSSLEDIIDREFQLVIGETARMNRKKVRRVVLCSGKVYYDLLEEREERGIHDIAIVRIEQLYPFPLARLRHILGKYGATKDIVWCQEEPQNQGAWYSIQHHIIDAMRQEQTLSYAGRLSSAAPAGGDARRHHERQRRLVDDALHVGGDAARVRTLSKDKPQPSAAAK